MRVGRLGTKFSGGRGATMYALELSLVLKLGKVGSNRDRRDAKLCAKLRDHNLALSREHVENSILSLLGGNPLRGVCHREASNSSAVTDTVPMLKQRYECETM